MLQRACAKLLKKRKAFDSKSQTVPEEARQVAEKSSGGGGAGGKGKKGPGMKGTMASRQRDEEPVGGGAGAPGKTKWEEKSSALRDAMRAARQYKAAIASGADPADIPMPAPSAPGEAKMLMMAVMRMTMADSTVVTVMLIVAACI